MKEQIIFNGKHVIIPLADVQHIEKKLENHNLVDGAKSGDLKGFIIVTKHTYWNVDVNFWANNIWLGADECDEFLKQWTEYLLTTKQLNNKEMKEQIIEITKHFLPLIYESNEQRADELIDLFANKIIKVFKTAPTDEQTISLSDINKLLRRQREACAMWAENSSIYDCPLITEDEY